jgi:hypothetical protein
MLEKTQPRIFHIHCDAMTEESKPLLEELKRELGFVDHHFTGHPDGRDHYEPVGGHVSLKILPPQEHPASGKALFDRNWQRAVDAVRRFPEAKGYLEGEFIPFDIAIPEMECKDFFPPSFQITTRRLDPARGESARETEIHLVMQIEGEGGSDRRIVEALYDAGLYGAYLGKRDHQAVVLTMQGYSRQIKPLMKELLWYLNAVGGVKRGSIKEEVALAIHRFGGMTVEDLPAIADTIEYKER